MKQQDEWETGIDAQFVRRLEQRQHRPGVWDQRYASWLIARHTRSGIEHDLTARLNQRWQALDEEPTAAVPIVYATPVAPVIMSQQSGNIVQQTVINSQQSPLSEDAGVSPTLPSRLAAALPIVTPSLSKSSGSRSRSLLSSSAIVPPFSVPAAALGNRNRSLTQIGVPEQEAGETAVPTPTRIRVTPRPLHAAPASPVQPQSASQQGNNAAPSPQSMASARPLPLVTVQPPPAQTADLPNTPMQSPSASQPVRAETTLGNLAGATSLPLVIAQPPPAQTAVLPTNPTPDVVQPSQPPSWMKKQAAPQGAPNIDVNIDTLTNKVEKQLLQRLLIQRERRGKA